MVSDLEFDPISVSTPVRLICLPAELSELVQPPELASYYVDGLLDPVRLNRRVLAQKESELGQFGYAGQYRQSPIPASGGMFKVECLRLEKSPPTKFMQVVRFWDKASCLIAGTLIETLRGQIPIEDVRQGDFVLTRAGYKYVEWAGVSGFVSQLAAVEFDSNLKLTGTPDHPVWTTNRGWVELQHLCFSDKVLSLTSKHPCKNHEIKKDLLGTQTLKSKCLMEFSIADGKAGDILRQCCTTKQQKSYMPPLFTDQNGNFTTDQFPMDIISTTKMEILTTTAFPILNVLNGKNIGKCMLSRWQEQVELPFGKMPNTTLTNVIIAEANSKAGTVGMLLILNILDIAVTDVVNMPENRNEKLIPVYDLTVRDCHEFFANNILVHNTAGGKGAYTAGVKMGRTLTNDPPKFWILDVVRGRWDSFTREKIIRQTAILDGKDVRIGVEMEPGSGGKESAENTMRNLSGYKAYAERPTGDKVARADPFSTAVNAGDVALVIGSWNTAYVDEMKYFGDPTSSAQKDQMDASSGCFNKIVHVKKRAGGAGF